MEKALRDAGVAVETLYYDTEGHGFYVRRIAASSTRACLLSSRKAWEVPLRRAATEPPGKV